MPKPPNTIKSKKITITTTLDVHSYLEQLVRGGLYGKNAAEAAERLISRGIEMLIRDGTIKLRSSNSQEVT